MLHAYPPGTSQRDGSGRSAVDLAKKSNSSFKAIYLEALELGTEFYSSTSECDFIDNPTDVYVHIAQSRWDNVKKIVTESPEEARTWVSQKRRDGRLSWRMLPAHACILFECPSTTLQAVLMAFPNGASCKDHAGMLPIHHALIRGAPLEVVEDLLTAYPSCLVDADREGRTPFTLVESSNLPQRGEYMVALERGPMHYQKRKIGGIVDKIGASMPTLAISKDYAGDNERKMLKSGATVERSRSITGSCHKEDKNDEGEGFEPMVVRSPSKSSIDKDGDCKSDLEGAAKANKTGTTTLTGKYQSAQCKSDDTVGALVAALTSSFSVSRDGGHKTLTVENRVAEEDEEEGVAGSFVATPNLSFRVSRDMALSSGEEMQEQKLNSMDTVEKATDEVGANDAPGKVSIATSLERAKGSASGDRSVAGGSMVWQGDRKTRKYHKEGTWVSISGSIGGDSTSTTRGRIRGRSLNKSHGRDTDIQSKNHGKNNGKEKVKGRGRSRSKSLKRLAGSLFGHVQGEQTKKECDKGGVGVVTMDGPKPAEEVHREVKEMGDTMIIDRKHPLVTEGGKKKAGSLKEWSRRSPSNTFNENHDLVETEDAQVDNMHQLRLADNTNQENKGAEMERDLDNTMGSIFMTTPKDTGMGWEKTEGTGQKKHRRCRSKSLKRMANSFFAKDSSTKNRDDMNLKEVVNCLSLSEPHIPDRTEDAHIYNGRQSRSSDNTKQEDNRMEIRRDVETAAIERFSATPPTEIERGRQKIENTGEKKRRKRRSKSLKRMADLLFAKGSGTKNRENMSLEEAVDWLSLSEHYGLVDIKDAHFDNEPKSRVAQVAKQEDNRMEMGREAGNSAGRPTTMLPKDMDRGQETTEGTGVKKHRRYQPKSLKRTKDIILKQHRNQTPTKKNLVDGRAVERAAVDWDLVGINAVDRMVQEEHEDSSPYTDENELYTDDNELVVIGNEDREGMQEKTSWPYGPQDIGDVKIRPEDQKKPLYSGSAKTKVELASTKLVDKAKSGTNQPVPIKINLPDMTMDKIMATRSLEPTSGDAEHLVISAQESMAEEILSACSEVEALDKEKEAMVSKKELDNRSNSDGEAILQSLRDLEKKQGSHSSKDSVDSGSSRKSTGQPCVPLGSIASSPSVRTKQPLPRPQSRDSNSALSPIGSTRQISNRAVNNHHSDRAPFVVDADAAMPRRADVYTMPSVMTNFLGETEDNSFVDECMSVRNRGVPLDLTSPVMSAVSAEWKGSGQPDAVEEKFDRSSIHNGSKSDKAEEVKVTSQVERANILPVGILKKPGTKKWEGGAISAIGTLERQFVRHIPDSGVITPSNSNNDIKSNTMQVPITAKKVQNSFLLNPIERTKATMPVRMKGHADELNLSTRRVERWTNRAKKRSKDKIFRDIPSVVNVEVDWGPDESGERRFSSSTIPDDESITVADVMEQTDGAGFVTGNTIVEARQTIELLDQHAKTRPVAASGADKRGSANEDDINLTQTQTSQHGNNKDGKEGRNKVVEKASQGMGKMMNILSNSVINSVDHLCDVVIDSETYDGGSEMSASKGVSHS